LEQWYVKYERLRNLERQASTNHEEMFCDPMFRCSLQYQ